MSTEKRAITIEDLYSMKWLGDPQISPDGKKVLYVQKTADPADKTKYLNQIWLCSLEDNHPPQAFSAGLKSDTTPRWSPCGTWVAFISNRSGTNQVWLMPAGGGEARQLTDFKRPLAGIVWSPDGKHLLATAKIGPDDDLPKDAERSDVKVITRLHYKMNGEGFHGDRRSHIFLITVASGEVKQLTDGDYDQSAPSWSSDGSKFAFTGKRFADADYASHNEIYEYIMDTGDIRTVNSVKGNWSSPSYSKNGSCIACFGHKGEYRGATDSKLWLFEASGGEPTQLLQEFDLAAGSSLGADMVSATVPAPIWSCDDSHIYFLAANGGSAHVYSVSAEGGVPKALTPSGRVVYGLSIHTVSDTLITAITSPENIGDLHLYKLGEASPRQLTFANSELLAGVHVALPEQYNFTASNGVTIEGWLLRPYGFCETNDPCKKVPLVLEIHGGPHSAYGLAFHHEMQVLAAAGFAVIFSNPQGSTGYGQDFVKATHHDWGGQDYRDVMGAVDAALAKWSFLDGENMGLTGGSYGGFMVNWIIGHSNRFKAAVTQRSTSSRFSMFGTSDVGYNNGEFEFDGKPWLNFQHYLDRSPLMFVENITTPVKIIHSEQDLRCPIEQGEQFYTALKWLKKTAVFVRFPNESHELSRAGQPKHRVERLQHILSWFKEYIEV